MDIWKVKIMFNAIKSFKIKCFTSQQPWNLYISLIRKSLSTWKVFGIIDKIQGIHSYNTNPIAFVKSRSSRMSQAIMPQPGELMLTIFN